LAGLLAACVALPTNESVAPPSAADFGNSAPETDFFASPAPAEVKPPTKFQPQLSFEIQSLKAGEEPAISTNIYQTKDELEIRETDTLIEKVAFNFDKLSVGQEIGYGKMEIGTPPKLTLDISLKVLSTDQKESAIVSVKASSLIASVYVADLQLKQLPGGLSIISLGNATRADDKNDVHTTQASARVIQTIYPGFLKLPNLPGNVRTRTVIYSEPDPSNQTAGVKVFEPSFTVVAP
jgi:hypothetical protein